jgi:predicted  nucleic acid-binding Zn-ribbon protein
MNDKPTIPQPTDPPTRTTLSILAQWFDERAASRRSLAEEFRGDYPEDFPEQDIIAKTFATCATITWELAGGRPGATPREHERFIKVSTADLAKLLALTEQIPKHSESDAEFAETNRVLTQSAQRIKDLTKERDQAKVRIVELELAIEQIRKRCNDAENDEMKRAQERDDALERVTTLEATIEQQRARIEELSEANRDLDQTSESLVKRIDELESLTRSTVEMSEKVSTQAEKITAYAKRIAELEERLVVPTVDGKTPGQVFADISSRTPLSLPIETAREIMAAGLLRAFCPQMVRGALEKVRGRIEEQFANIHDYGVRCEAREIIDDEIAKLGANVDLLEQAQPTTPSGRILLGITFQRELPDGSRETLNPSTVRLVVGDDPTRLVPVALSGQTP